MNSKIYIILAAACAVIVISIAVVGIGENRVSNLYLIPSGVFDPVHEANPLETTGYPTGTMLTTPANTSRQDRFRTENNSKSLKILADYGDKNETFAVDRSSGASFDPDKFTEEIQEDMDPYLYPNGPVTGYGYDFTGSIAVMYNPDSPVNRTLMDEIYTNISAKGKNHGFNAIPCHFVAIGVVKPDIAKDTITPLNTKTVGMTG